MIKPACSYGFPFGFPTLMVGSPPCHILSSFSHLTVAPLPRRHDGASSGDPERRLDHVRHGPVAVTFSAARISGLLRSSGRGLEEGQNTKTNWGFLGEFQPENVVRRVVEKSCSLRPEICTWGLKEFAILGVKR